MNDKIQSCYDGFESEGKETDEDFGDIFQLEALSSPRKLPSIF